MKKIKIDLKDYCHQCHDGCCTDYGTEIKVDGIELESTSMDVANILNAVLTHLGFAPEIEIHYDE